MKTGTILFIAGGAALAAGGVGAYYFYQRQLDLLKNHLKYKIIWYSISKNPDDPSLVDFNFKVRITSDSTIEAKVKKLYLEIFVDGTKLGIIQNTTFKAPDGTERDYFIIPAKGFSDVPLKLTFSPKLLTGSLVSGILNYIGNKDMTLNLTGYIKIQSWVISISVPFTYQTTLKEIMAPSTVPV